MACATSPRTSASCAARMYSRTSSAIFLSSFSGPLQRSEELLALLAQVPRLIRVDVLEERLRRGRPERLRLLDRRVRLFENLRAELVVLRLRPELLVHELLEQPVDGIAPRPFVDFLLIAVARGIVRGAVRADAVGLRF